MVRGVSLFANDRIFKEITRSESNNVLRSFPCVPQAGPRAFIGLTSDELAKLDSFSCDAAVKGTISEARDAIKTQLEFESIHIAPHLLGVFRAKLAAVSSGDAAARDFQDIPCRLTSPHRILRDVGSRQHTVAAVCKNSNCRSSGAVSVPASVLMCTFPHPLHYKPFMANHLSRVVAIGPLVHKVKNFDLTKNKNTVDFKMLVIIGKYTKKMIELCLYC